MTWMTALPFVLWPTCGLLAAPLSLLISFLLLGKLGWVLRAAAWLGGKGAQRSCADLAAAQVPPPSTAACPRTTAGIDKIGVSIEEPFSILALSDIANNAAGDVRELCDMHEAGPGQQHVPCPELVGTSALDPCCCGMHNEGSSSILAFSQDAAPVTAPATDSQALDGGARMAVLAGDGA